MSVPAREGGPYGRHFFKGRMRGAVPAKKKDTERENDPTPAKKRRRSSTKKPREKKSSANAELPEETQAEAQAGGKVPKKRSASLRGAARRVKEAIPDIVDRMVEEAKKGNVQHVKTVLHCTGVDKLLEQECQPRKKKSLAELLIRRLETQNENGESGGSRTESE